jgi:hypothetical protein
VRNCDVFVTVEVTVEVEVEVTVDAGSVLVTVVVPVLPGAVLVTVVVPVLPGAVLVTVVVPVLPGSVVVEVAVVDGFAAYTAAAPTTNPPTAAAPIFKNVLLEGSEVGFSVSVIGRRTLLSRIYVFIPVGPVTSTSESSRGLARLSLIQRLTHRHLLQETF